MYYVVWLAMPTNHADHNEEDVLFTTNYQGLQKNQRIRLLLYFKHWKRSFVENIAHVLELAPSLIMVS